VRVYLRPEDRVAEGALDGLANRVWGEVSNVEFLGGSCLAEMRIDELDGQPLLISFSLNQMHDLGVRVGARLEMALRSDRLRVF
jgi:iron(III) transport system ATP-binding protein